MYRNKSLLLYILLSFVTTYYFKLSAALLLVNKCCGKDEFLSKDQATCVKLKDLSLKSTKDLLETLIGSRNESYLGILG